MTIESKKKMLENAKSSFLSQEIRFFLLLIDMGLLLPSDFGKAVVRKGRRASLVGKQESFDYALTKLIIY